MYEPSGLLVAIRAHPPPVSPHRSRRSASRQPQNHACGDRCNAAESLEPGPQVRSRQDQLTGWHAAPAEIRKDITMISRTKRRVAWRIGAVLAAAAAGGTLGI